MEINVKKTFVIFVYILCANFCFAQSTVKRNKTKDANRTTQVVSRSNNRNRDVGANTNSNVNRNNGEYAQQPQQPAKFDVMIDSKIHQIAILNGSPNDLKRYTLRIGASGNFDNAKGYAQRYNGFLIYDYTEGLYVTCVGNTDKMNEIESIKEYFGSQHYVTGVIIYKYGY